MRQLVKGALAIVLWGLMLACTNVEQEAFPLPDGTERNDALCAEVAMSDGDRCYQVPLAHKQTLDWFDEKAGSEQWQLVWTSDVTPFTAVLAKDDRQMVVIFYRQQEDSYTGVLMKDQLPNPN